MRNNAPNMQRCLTNKCVRLVVRILCVWGARAGATDAVLVIKFADGCGGIKIEAGDADEESDADAGLHSRHTGIPHERV